LCYTRIQSAITNWASLDSEIS